MRTIPLTQGKVALVDDVDFKWLSRWKWYAMKHRNTYYAVRCIRRNSKKKKIWMHREILKPLQGVETDHKDGNGLNNCFGNLRIATPSENQANQRIRIGSSKYKGVYWLGRRRKWCARIQVKGKIIFLGNFDNEELAAHVYDEAAQKHFGEFARTNFYQPGGGDLFLCTVALGAQ